MWDCVRGVGRSVLGAEEPQMAAEGRNTFNGNSARR
jgi:hypothetical protein